MTKEQVIELAKQLEIWPEPGKRIPPVQVFRRNLEQFATVVRNAALEECAKKCESFDPHPDQWSDQREYTERRMVNACAEAIRNLKEPTERKPVFTTGHCKEKAKAGGCQLHNLQCGYPACDRKLT